MFELELGSETEGRQSVCVVFEFEMAKETVPSRLTGVTNIASCTTT